jgi:hypothetical protein
MTGTNAGNPWAELTEGQLRVFASLVDWVAERARADQRAQPAAWFATVAQSARREAVRRQTGGEEIPPLVPESTTELRLDEPDDLFYVIRWVQGHRDQIPEMPPVMRDLFHQLLIALVDARDQAGTVARELLATMYLSPQERDEIGELLD